MNLVLIGYRGTGKSTVARLLAERLGWAWHDGDVEIEARAGKSIARIFAEEGEPAFRDWESRVVAELCDCPRVVLALGGGAVMREENRAAIARQGRVVWLRAQPETLWRRIQADGTSAARRPNLTSAGGIAEIIATLDKREPVYQQCSDLEIDTEGKTPGDVADAILRELKLG